MASKDAVTLLGLIGRGNNDGRKLNLVEMAHGAFSFPDSPGLSLLLSV
jgi:hypothetical protein